MRINYNKLYYFYEFSRCLNMTEAAKQLFISQPSLSNAMHELQKELGTALFVRQGRTLRLTPAGVALQTECKIIFGREDRILDTVRDAANQETGTLRIAYMRLEFSSTITPLMRDFAKRYPYIQTSLYRQNWDALRRSIDRKSVDIGISLTQDDEVLPDCFAHFTLCHSSLAVILPKDHPLAQRTTLCISELKDEPFIVLSPKGYPIPYASIISMCRNEGFEPQIAGADEQIETILMAVRAGFGITILSPLVPQGEMGGLACIPLVNAPTLTISLIWHKKNTNPAVGKFVQLAKAWYLSTQQPG